MIPRRRHFLNTVVAGLALCALMACSGGADTSSSANAETEATPPAEESLNVGKLMNRGRVIYQQQCLACHMADGQGVTGTHPPVAGADFVNGEVRPLVRYMLYGADAVPARPAYDSFLEMPVYDWLKDEELAAVLTYIRQSFGNDAAPVTPATVADVRAEGPPGGDTP